tara:strand:+ start:2211 stop:2948 length:738 start_codon:yes stop_codon:yes gene_type:complete
MLDDVGNFLFGGPKDAPTMSAADLGFDQGTFDDLKTQRAGYIDKFEGAGGYADRAGALGAQGQGFLNKLTGAGGLYDQMGDASSLMQDQSLYAGMLEQQGAGQDRANQEMLRRQLSGSGMSPGETSGFLNRFRGMTDPFNERGAANQLQAANMSMQNRTNMLGQQAGLLGQGGQMLQGQSGLLGQEVNLGTMGFQDAIAQMNQMDQARLAAAGMDFQGKMGAFNAPTGTDKLIGAVGAVGGFFPG